MTTNGENPTPKPATDIFQELREKKLKQSDLKAIGPAAVPVGVEKGKADSRNKFTSLIIAALIGALIGVAGATSGNARRELSNDNMTDDEAALAISSSMPKNEDAAPASSKSKHAAALIESMETKYNAANWSSTIQKNRRTNPFSIEIDDGLIRSDARPVVVRCTILDIAYGDNNIVTKFGIRDAGGHFKTVLILRSEPEKLKIFAPALRGITEYAVVAKCDSAGNNSEREHLVMGRLIEAINLSAK